MIVQKMITIDERVRSLLRRRSRAVKWVTPVEFWLEPADLSSPKGCLGHCNKGFARSDHQASKQKAEDRVDLAVTRTYFSYD